MPRYVGTQDWLDVDQQHVTVGSPTAQTPAVRPIQALTAAVNTPTPDGGGVLTMVFTTVGRTGELVSLAQEVSLAYDPQTAASFQALAGWLRQVVTVNHQQPPAPSTPVAVPLAAPAATPTAAPTAPAQTLNGLVGQAQQAAVEAARQDHQVTLDGGQRINALICALGLTWDQARQAIPQAWHDLFLGHPEPPTPSAVVTPPATPAVTARSRVSPVPATRPADGLPVVDPSDIPLVLHPGEVIHGLFQAQLLKQTVQREFRGGSAGFSFPLGHGIRMRTGSMRGHSVVVGTTSSVADTGPLIVTSTRTVFVGRQHTLESDYPKLVGLRASTPWRVVSLGRTNRQRARTIREFEISRAPEGEGLCRCRSHQSGGWFPVGVRAGGLPPGHGICE